jgi:hypothetical protein
MLRHRRRLRYLSRLSHLFHLFHPFHPFHSSHPHRSWLPRSMQLHARSSLSSFRFPEQPFLLYQPLQGTPLPSLSALQQTPQQWLPGAGFAPLWLSLRRTR